MGHTPLSTEHLSSLIMYYVTDSVYCLYYIMSISVGSLVNCNIVVITLMNVMAISSVNICT